MHLLFFIDYDILSKCHAGVAELADAPDLGSGGRPCRFKSCHPQENCDKRNMAKSRISLATTQIICYTINVKRSNRQSG